MKFLLIKYFLFIKLSFNVGSINNIFFFLISFLFIKYFKNLYPDNLLTFSNLKILKSIQKNPLSNIAIFELINEL